MGVRLTCAQVSAEWRRETSLSSQTRQRKSLSSLSSPSSASFPSSPFSLPLERPPFLRNLIRASNSGRARDPTRPGRATTPMDGGSTTRMRLPGTTTPARRFSRAGIAFPATNPTAGNSSSGGGSLSTVISRHSIPLGFFRCTGTPALVLSLLDNSINLFVVAKSTERAG